MSFFIFSNLKIEEPNQCSWDFPLWDRFANLSHNYLHANLFLIFAAEAVEESAKNLHAEICTKFAKKVHEICMDLAGAFPIYNCTREFSKKQLYFLNLIWRDLHFFFHANIVQIVGSMAAARFAKNLDFFFEEDFHHD